MAAGVVKQHVDVPAAGAGFVDEVGASGFAEPAGEAFAVAQDRRAGGRLLCIEVEHHAAGLAVDVVGAHSGRAQGSGARVQALFPATAVLPAVAGDADPRSGGDCGRKNFPQLVCGGRVAVGVVAVQQEGAILSHVTPSGGGKKELLTRSFLVKEIRIRWSGVQIR